MTVGSGTFVIGAGTTIPVDPGADAADAVALLRTTLASSGIGSSDGIADGSGDGRTISFDAPDDAAPDSVALGVDGYVVDISVDAIVVQAEHHDGFCWAVQTLLQLLDGATAPVGRIVDIPRYAWRGTMLDVSRHFFTVADILTFVAIAASYKLNRVHLHLTDDQAWRLRIESHPALTDIGGANEVGGGPGGSYSQDDYRSIVQHAQALGVTIIPEIDVPGHTNAALVSIPSLNCDGLAPQPYTGASVGFSSLCIDQEATYTWLDDVIGEVAALTPGPWIHIGGDEAHSTADDAYGRFIGRALAIVERHGKVAIGWGEIGRVDLPASTIVQHWLFPQSVLRASERGADVILSPAGFIYFDMKYDESSPVGTNWAGYIDTQRCYEWDPDTNVDGLDPDRVIGIEAPVWTEWIIDRTNLEQMILPRLPAIAEVAWSAQADRSWESLRERLTRHASRWSAAGWSWTRDPAIDWPAR